MDLETRNINGILEPICLCLFDGENKTSFFINDYSNSDEIMKAGIRFIMKRKYYGARVYLHNFGKFDGVFLLKILSELGIGLIKPIINDNKIIQIPFNFITDNSKKKKSKGTLHFYDSYSILPDSLEKLAKYFNVDNKGIFPHLFVNDFNLDYEGDVPDFKYFIKVDYNIYLDYKKNFEGK
jgi:hypothetical protein